MSPDAIAQLVADLPAADELLLPNGSMIAVVDYGEGWALRRTDFAAGRPQVSAVRLPSEDDGRRRLRAIAATIKA